ncbi:PD-(D/E)XK nuclease family protein [Cellvibrio sp. ARAG 10.3]|uniref:PD-(D/E)XK nuclease family protein n=1 Tax=Cellvibrio sp. ARAG 10.3 TaxID=3451358 RepID=UPI003F480A3E
MDSFENFLTVLHDFESLPAISESESIFDVAGYPHYENVCSNILAFYLNPNNEHGLGSLLFSSLMSLAESDDSSQGNFQVYREYSTKKGGRLDLLIETDNQLIGIENKVFHELRNDLYDYSRTIDEISGQKKLSPVKIVLSIKAHAVDNGFVGITYKNFIAEIRQRLGLYAGKSSQKWLLYLLDFMSSMENFTGKNMELDELDQFFIKHHERVDKLLTARNKFMSKLYSKVNDLSGIMEKSCVCEKKWIYAKACLVHDFMLSGHSIAFDLHISPTGWKFLVFGRNEKSHAYLSELLLDPSICEFEITCRDSRYILEEFSLATDLMLIKEKLLSWFSRIVDADNTRTSILTIG